MILLIFLFFQRFVRNFRIPAAQCHRHRKRQACLNAQEPYCGWNEHLMKCDQAPMQNHLANHWLQEVTKCPVLTDPVDGGWSAWSTWQPCQHGTAEMATSHRGSHSRGHSDNSEVIKIKFITINKTSFNSH